MQELNVYSPYRQKHMKYTRQCTNTQKPSTQKRYNRKTVNQSVAERAAHIGLLE